MGIIDKIVGRLGLGVDPRTGERVRTRAVPCDDWGNTMDEIQRKDGVTGEWKPIGDVPGSKTGGHY